MAQLAIKGHETRGGEVIEILEMLGGKNTFGHYGENSYSVYYVDKSYKNYIFCSPANEDSIIFSLEEFLEKFPYKIGDKVLAYCEGTFAQFTIQDIRWNYELNRIEYKICSCWCDTSLMQPYQEELITMEERKNTDLRIDVDQDDKLATEATIDGNKITPPENYLIGKITKMDNGMLVEFVKKQQQYPKDYEECCDVMGYRLLVNTMIGHKASILETFQKLLICRDAYWKLAGEQMGLGKPWQPDWNTKELKYIIYYENDKLWFNDEISRNTILAFPTEEMRDAFYENFNDLIESCKEFL